MPKRSENLKSFGLAVDRIVEIETVHAKSSSREPG